MNSWIIAQYENRQNSGSTSSLL